MATVFESKTCSRCGGGGSYSFNLMHGSTCYGCSGTGQQLTKRGRAAQAHLIALQTKPASEIKVGDNIWFDATPGGRSRWCFVSEIQPDTMNPGHVKMELTRAGKAVCLYCASAESSIRSVRNEEERANTVATALAFQDTLNENGKPKKSKA
jgi:hypothetical protein